VVISTSQAHLGSLLSDMGLRVLQVDAVAAAASGGAARAPARATVARVSSRTAAASAGNQESPLAEAECHVIFTSGTTGVPKGVICTWANLLAYCRDKNASHGVGSTARVLLTCALTWDPAVGDIVSTLMAGATLMVASRASVVHDLGGVVARSACTHAFATPSHWALVSLPPAQLPHLCVLTLGGERVPPAMVTHWTTPTLRVLNMYGVTEAAVGQTVYHLRPGMPTSIVGRPLGDHRVGFHLAHIHMYIQPEMPCLFFVVVVFSCSFPPLFLPSPFSFFSSFFFFFFAGAVGRVAG
jgi:non-ribosomal peptide synthetase component F